MAENRSGARESVDRLLESKLDSVDEAEELVIQMAEKAGFEEDDLHKIAMSVRESMVNAVVHENRYNAHKKVHVTISNGPGKLETRVAVKGDGFKITKFPVPMVGGDLLRNSGSVISCMRALWTRCRY